jgi:hypothetical protein
MKETKMIHLSGMDAVILHRDAAIQRQLARMRFDHGSAVSVDDECLDLGCREAAHAPAVLTAPLARRAQKPVDAVAG